MVARDYVVKITALRVLDLHDVDVRKGVLTFDGAKVSSLYEGDLARDFR